MKVQKILISLFCVAATMAFKTREDKTFGGEAKAQIVSKQGTKREVEVDTDCVWKTESEAKKQLFSTLKQVILQDERVAKINYEISNCQ